MEKYEDLDSSVIIAIASGEREILIFLSMLRSNMAKICAIKLHLLALTNDLDV